MAYGYYLEAKYDDGYIHSEQELNDVSPYAENKNIFNDILNQRPAKEHGKLVLLSCVPENGGNRYDIAWADFPEDAKPIYYRSMERKFTVDGWQTDPYATAHYFGYEFHDENGEKQKEIIEIPIGS